MVQPRTFPPRVPLSAREKAFAAILGLVVVMLGARAMILHGAGRWFDLPTPVFLPYLPIAAYQDLAFCAIVGWISWVTLSTLRSEVAKRAGSIVIWSICLFAATWAAVNLIVYYLLGTSVTYGLLVLSDHLNLVRGALRYEASPARLFKIAASPLIVVAISFALCRYAPGLLSRFGAGFHSLRGAVVLLLYLVGGTLWAAHNPQYYPVICNPEWRFCESVSDRSAPFVSSKIPTRYTDDFLAVGRRSAGVITAAATKPATQRRANIVLIVMESVGARYLGTYGAPFPDTPELDRLAQHAAVFDNVYVRASLEENTRWNLALSAELCRLAESFKEHAIAFVPLKGPLLSQQLYGDLSMRSSVDLDWLVHPRDVLRVRDVLTARGNRIASALHWQSDSAVLRCREAEITLYDEARSLTVDLHWRILPSYFASSFDHQEVWQSLVSTPFCGRRLPALCPEHLIQLLCSHAAKHAFERLGWICDIASCVIAFPNLRWPEVMAASARAGTMRELVLGLKLADDLLGVPMPVSMPEDPVVRELVPLMRERMLALAPIPISESELIPLCMRVFESPRHRIRYMLGQLAPSRAEYEVLQLPPSLYFLYYLLRPIRLITRHAPR